MNPTRELARESYPYIREVLADPYRDYSAEELEGLFVEAGIDPAELEEFFGAISRLGGQIAQGVQRFVPQVQQFVQSPQFQAGLQGAMQGGQTGMVAGPKGAAIGAGIGFLSGLLGGQPPAGPTPPPAPGMQMPAPAAPVAPLVPQPPTVGGSPAAGQLLGLLGQPQVLQALMAMLLGQAGTRTVSVGGAQVPVGQVPGTLAGVANLAQAEHAAVLTAAGEEVEWATEAADAVNLLQLFGREAAQERVAARQRTRATVRPPYQPLEASAAVEYEPVY
jgi:hypothetical protein